MFSWKKKDRGDKSGFNGSVAVSFEHGGVFAPGQKVSGQLIWQRERGCSLGKITASLRGTLTCPNFREPGGVRTVLHSSARAVWQAPSGSNNPSTEPKGKSEYRFELRDLPAAGSGLPDSFSWEEEGIVCAYWIEFMFYTGDKQQHACRAPFHVATPISDHRSLPLQAEKIPNFLKSLGKLSYTISSVPNVVAPGSAVEFDFHIVNHSNKNITCLGIQLERRSQLHGRKQEKTVASAVFTADDFFLPRHDKQATEPPSIHRVFVLHVPDNAYEVPNSWDFRGVLTVKYQLVFTLMIGKSRWSVNKPVTVRHAPFISRPSSASSSSSSSSSSQLRPQQSHDTIKPHRPAPPPPMPVAASLTDLHYYQPPPPQQQPYPPGGMPVYIGEPMLPSPYFAAPPPYGYDQQPPPYSYPTAHPEPPAFLYPPSTHDQHLHAHSVGAFPPPPPHYSYPPTTAGTAPLYPAIEPSWDPPPTHQQAWQSLPPDYYPKPSAPPLDH